MSVKLLSARGSVPKTLQDRHGDDPEFQHARVNAILQKMVTELARLVTVREVSGGDSEYHTIEASILVFDLSDQEELQKVLDARATDN